MALRTKERGLLTTADALRLTFTIIELRKSAHGGDVLASKGCRACDRMEQALGRWLNAHGASEKELDELVAARVPVYCKQASHRYSGRQGDIPDALWAIKETPW